MFVAGSSNGATTGKTSLADRQRTRHALNILLAERSAVAPAPARPSEVRRLVIAQCRKKENCIYIIRYKQENRLAVAQNAMTTLTAQKKLFYYTKPSK